MKLLNVNDDDIAELQNNRDIDKIFTINEIGYASFEESQNESKPYLKVYSMNYDSFKSLNFNLLEGTFPKNKNEIIISQHIIENAEVNYKIGDTIKINVGERKTLDNYELNEHNPYKIENEQITNTQEYEFTIVGIIERPSYNFENLSDPGYTVITSNIESKNKEAYISLKNPKDYKNSIVELLGASDYESVESNSAVYEDGMNNLKYPEYELNKELLRWEAFAFSNSTVNMLYAVIGVVIFIIIFTSIFCIRNSFAISVTEKIKMYGMLSSIGATKNQIRKTVF